MNKIFKKFQKIFIHSSREDQCHCHLLFKTAPLQKIKRFWTNLGYEQKFLFYIFISFLIIVIDVLKRIHFWLNYVHQ
ncbi:hypothetical protein DERP_014132 [Dermatophagoides pteronyssinus]|uniref:Uncharacterized protein n=1 Tax=Dermatophagoides pteronyssinus TaxID=6956 RepID=A0ABQ8IXB1_DERPT|nr:hypothetical protein DERP_014132 [Dermatophagoides pteronyssinus]